MYKMFIVITLWCELMNKYILSVCSMFFGTFDNMTQVTILRSCSCLVAMHYFLHVIVQSEL